MINSRMILLPVARSACHISPITVQSELALRTTNTSPYFLNLLINETLFKSCTFLLEDNKITSIEQFLTNFSIYDFKVFLWGLFETTYRKFENVELVCPNCSHLNKKSIWIKDIFDQNKLIPWTYPENFNEYFFDITVDSKEISKFIIRLKLPNLLKKSNCLGYFTVPELKANFNIYSSIYSKKFELMLFIDKIIVDNQDMSDLEDIFVAINKLFDAELLKKLLLEIENKFKKLDPIFNFKCNCSECSYELQTHFDFEYILYRNMIEYDLENNTYKKNYENFIESFLTYQRIFEYNGSLQEILNLPYCIYNDVFLGQIKKRKKEIEEMEKLKKQSTKRRTK